MTEQQIKDAITKAIPFNKIQFMLVQLMPEHQNDYWVYILYGTDYIEYCKLSIYGRKVFSVKGECTTTIIDHINDNLRTAKNKIGGEVKCI